MAHRLGNAVSESEQESCTSEAVQCVTSVKCQGNRKETAFKRTQTVFRESSLRLVQAGKTGEFAVLNNELYQAKAHDALSKNFQRAEDMSQKALKAVRTSAGKFCEEAGHGWLN